MIDGLDIDEPDWTPFDGEPPCENTCSCGRVWHCHAKSVTVKPPAEGAPSLHRALTCLARVPCPLCGSRTRVRRSSTPPERWSV